MPDETRARFNSGAVALSDYNQQPLGRIRQELTWQNLVRHLPDASGQDPPPTVLDAGGGSGELALRLVRHGYRVWLLDYAPAMLDQARQAAQSLDAEARARLVIGNMAVEDAEQYFDAGFFDVIACHTLLEYLVDPATALGSLAGLLHGGGLVSVSCVNRHAEVLRRVWSRGDPWRALEMLEEADRPRVFRAALFDLQGRAYGAEEVVAWLDAVGFATVAVYGIRVFADFLPSERLHEPGFFEAVLGLETAVADRAPYSRLARYFQLVAHKNTMPQVSASGRHRR